MGQAPAVDQNYRVDGLPSAIKGKVTQFANAAMDYAMVGAAHPMDVRAIEEYYHESRYELERTIQTYLEGRGK